MLIPMPIQARADDPIYALIAQINGNSPDEVELQPGIYRIGHFGGSSFLRSFEQYPDFDAITKDGEEVWRNAYGVCDSVEQLLAHFPELEAPGRNFVVTFNEVRKASQPEDGGWRWHKWGPYIGTHDIQCEYLYDEKGIESVFVYHIYEKIDYAAMSNEELKQRYEKKFCRQYDSESRHWVEDDQAGAQRVALIRALSR